MTAKVLGFVVAALAAGVACTPALAQDHCAPMIAAAGTPKYKGTAPPHVTLCRDGYVLSHNMERLTPDWVIEVLSKDRFTGDADRKAEGDPFKADPDLKKGERAELKDYRGSGYDRGHMAPAGDMTYGVEALRESFYLSNMTPQVGIGFNRHIWADLEGLVRDWACDRAPGTLVAISGPIYDDEPPKPLKKRSDVALPTHFYKIAYDPKARRAIAFILPNKKINTKGMRVADALQPYIVSVRTVEARAGINFFAAFSRRRQAALEAHKSAIWAVHDGCIAD